MSILAEATAAQEFGKDAEGNIRWPTPGADLDAAFAAARGPTAAAAPAAAPAPAAPVTPSAGASRADIPEPPLLAQSAVDNTEVKKKTLLGA